MADSRCASNGGWVDDAVASVETNRSAPALTHRTSRSEGFKKEAEAAGNRWPEGWVKGEGLVRSPANHDVPRPYFAEVAEEYVRQVVDLSPG